jgi:peptide/nickel transport system ATP-binding protein
MDHNGNQPILSVRGLRTYFLQDEGTVQAVEDVSFDVYKGRTLGIVGESGCGKTVTAKSILRIVEPPGRVVQGEILLRKSLYSGQRKVQNLTKMKSSGKEIRAIRGADIALIFQEPMTSLSLVHTVENQIVEAIQLHQEIDKHEARLRAIELLHSVGIPRPERTIDMYPFELSGGLRQRVVIAMALSCEPEILIADEPTTALDVTTQAQILDLLRALQEEKGMAIILITHNMGVIAEMCDDVAVMYLGYVVERGPIDDIFHSPKHPYTKALLKSIPSVLSTPRTRLPTIEGAIPHPYARPSGCPFYPRCPDFIPGTCDASQAESVLIDKQVVRCFLYNGA